MTKEQQIAVIDEKIAELQAKLDDIDRIERDIFELEKLKALLPLYFPHCILIP
jgi:hypothetical protein